MDAITDLTNKAGQNTSEPTVATNADAGTKDMFLKLLVAQIRNQNPLEPNDPAEFVNQLAQLSQTEAMQNMVAQTSNSASILESLQVLSLGAQVGSEVTVRTDVVDLDAVSLSGSFQLDEANSSVAVVLTAPDGQKHRVELGAQSAGTVYFSVDPKTLGLAPGKYDIAIDGGEGVTPDVEIRSELTSVKLSPAGGVLLQVAHLGEVPSHAITGFHGRPKTTNS
jgi:flagellar basal-body rod modification protein FlgD